VKGHDQRNREDYYEPAVIANNMQARKDAEEIIAFCGYRPPRFWEILADMASANLPPKPQPAERWPALNEQEAMRFEATPMPYGKHAGDAVGIVPCDYLLFLTEGDEFSQRLRRYVKSKRFADRQED
jgi:hypothetical protein